MDVWTIVAASYSQPHNLRSCGWVKMKQYRWQLTDQWRCYTGSRQVIWTCCKAYALAVEGESSFELVKFELSSELKTEALNIWTWFNIPTPFNWYTGVCTMCILSVIMWHFSDNSITENNIDNTTEGLCINVKWGLHYICVNTGQLMNGWYVIK